MWGLVQNGDIVFSATSASMTATVTPVTSATGVVNIFVTVSDGVLSTETTMTLTIVSLRPTQVGITSVLPSAAPASGQEFTVNVELQDDDGVRRANRCHNNGRSQT